MKTSSQNSLINCHVCQCKLELNSSLCFLDGDEKCSEECMDLSDFSARLRDSFDTAQSGNILEIICNSSSPLQFPLCKKCSVSVSAELNKQLSDLETECVNYKQALDQLVSKRTPFDSNSAKTKLDQLRKEENELLEELKRLDEEELSLQKELETKQKERNATKERDAELYRRLRDNHRMLIEQSEENRSLRTQIKFVNEQLRRLAKTQILDMTFFIWMDGDYGTINGLRLGRLRHELVEWNEINAAFGQIALLLQVLAERTKYTFDGFDICPCGSNSFIRTSRGTELTLYGSGGWRPFGQPNLDQAIIAYMECFCQLENKLKSYFSQGAQILPYRMTKDMLIDNNSPYVVKMQLNSEERWTRAMKCLLSNLKRTIAIVANIRSPTASASTNSTVLVQKETT